MTHDHIQNRTRSSDIPRRLKLSAREIGVAVALTFAALVQLVSALSGRDSRSVYANADGQDAPPPLVRPAR